jgi:D-lactate dehydrogenase (cytochrome)
VSYRPSERDAAGVDCSIMRSNRIQTRAPRGGASELSVQRDPDVLAAFIEDAAHYPGGHAAGLVVATCEADVSRALQANSAVLPIGAQSSLTGGATPMGETLLSTSRLNRILDVGGGVARVQPGVTLIDLDAALEREGCYYPPVPTFTGAFVGGAVATNAAGAATFKYGTTRQWVQAVTVVLPNGEVVDITRGAVRADDAGRFEIASSDRLIRLDVPKYTLPRVPKCSAGYFAAPGMDVIDLFIGSEGTLGVITEVTLRVVAPRPAICLAFVPFETRAAALQLVRRLIDEARRTWESCDPNGLDVSAIEHMDARCLALLREDGIDERESVPIPARSSIALLVTIELPAATTAEQAYEDIGRARESAECDTPLATFCRVLDDAGVLDDVEIAVPGDRARAAQLLAVREAVPAAVNARVGRAKQAIDARIAKTAADMIVPFEQLDGLMRLYDDEFAHRGLDAAVWGHVSDGNLHPNVIPRSYADVEAGYAAILEFGRAVIAMGGSPLAEHGVGRNRIKQQLLQALYGEEGIEQMRRVKRAIDPGWKLAPGVLFPHR